MRESYSKVQSCHDWRDKPCTPTSTLPRNPDVGTSETLPQTLPPYYCLSKQCLLIVSKVASDSAGLHGPYFWDTKISVRIGKQRQVVRVRGMAAQAGSELRRRRQRSVDTADPADLRIALLEAERRADAAEFLADRLKAELKAVRDSVAGKRESRIRWLVDRIGLRLAAYSQKLRLLNDKDELQYLSDTFRDAYYRSLGLLSVMILADVGSMWEYCSSLEIGTVFEQGVVQSFCFDLVLLLVRMWVHHYVAPREGMLVFSRWALWAWVLILCHDVMAPSTTLMSTDEGFRTFTLVFIGMLFFRLMQVHSLHFRLIVLACWTYQVRLRPHAHAHGARCAAPRPHAHAHPSRPPSWLLPHLPTPI